jgi:hypothetical protein
VVTIVVPTSALLEIIWNTRRPVLGRDHIAEFIQTPDRPPVNVIL